MTATADQILDRLTRLAAHDEAPETAAELAQAIGANPSTVSTALKRLAYLGKVKQADASPAGAKTWALTCSEETR
jgi:DNA-binding IclR family transcriptional regulator